MKSRGKKTKVTFVSYILTLILVFNLIASSQTMAEAATALPAPVNVSAVSGGSDSIKLTWSPVTGASGYNIYRAASSTGTYSYVGSAWAAPEYINKGLTTGTTYYYMVRAYKIVNSVTQDGIYSEIVSAAPLASGQLAAPTGVLAVPGGSDSIKLTWNAVAGASGYNIYRAASSTGTYSYIGSAWAAPEYTNKGLAADTTYYYKVRAYKKIDTLTVDGLYSQVVSALTKANAVMGAPTVVMAVPGGSDSIRLTWNTVTGASGYNIYRAYSSTGTYSYIGSAWAVPEYINKGLTADTTYYYKVRAYKKIGTVTEDGLYSSIVTAKTDAAVPVLAAPENLQAASDGNDRIRLTWNAAAGASGYNIYRAESENGTALLIKSGLNALEYTDTGLSPATRYYYTVKAYQISGTSTLEGNSSASASALTPAPIQILTAPGNFIAAKAGQSAIRLTWDAVTGADGYNIYRAFSSEGPYVLIASPSGTLEFTNTGLTAETPCFYKISAFKLNGGLPEEGIVSAVLPASTVAILPAPTGAAAVSASTDSIKITWNQVAGANGYNIYRSSAPQGSYSYVGSAWTGPEYTNTGLTAGTAYYYKIRPYRYIGSITEDGIYSDFAWAIPGGTAIDTFPAPTNVSALTLSSDSIKITWDPVTRANGYNIYKASSAAGPFSYIGSAWAAPEYVSKGLEQGTIYYYKVRPYKYVGTITKDGDYSLIVSAQTTQLLPAPDRLTAVSAGSDSIYLTWNSLSGAAGYRLYRSSSLMGTYIEIAPSVSETYFTDTGLTAGTNYYYKVRAIPSLGTESGLYSNAVWASPAADSSMLAAPAGLYAASSGTDSIRITWNSVTGAAGYKVYRSPEGSEPFEYLASTGETAEYTDTGLTPGTTYYYKVTAFKTTETVPEEGAFSESVSAATAELPQILPAPTNVTAISAGSDRIRISWSPVTGASGYNIYRYSSITDTYQYIGSAWSAPEYTGTDLTTGITYSFKVRAYRKIGTLTEDGLYSEAVSAAPEAQTVPDALLITQGIVPYSGKRIALTFDDKADEAHITSILSILDQYGIKATFFVIGEWVLENPGLVQEMSKRGHSIQSHASTHIDLKIQSDEEIRRQLQLSRQTIFNIVGIAPTLLRPPYGSYSPSVLRIALEEGFNDVILWTVDSHDWADTISGQTVTTDYIVNRVLTNASNNGIVLFHMWPDKALEALPRIIEGLKAQDYTFATVDELVP